MKRFEAIKAILAMLNEEDIALFTTGMISREAFHFKDRKANFYMIGSMGLVSSVALGIALNTEKKVVIFDGDGSVLMDMGTMAMIASEKPVNLIHIVLDNESYQSTGGQPTVSNTVQLSKIAMDSGYAYSTKVDTEEKLKTVSKDIMTQKGPSFILIKTLGKTEEKHGRVSLVPFQLKERFMQYSVTI